MARVYTVEKYRGPRTEGKVIRCGRSGCGKVIEKGEKYFWWKNRAPGMRSGVKHNRCAAHYPTIAERTPGRRGQLYAIQEDIERQAAEARGYDDLVSVAESAAEQLREIAEEIQEGADNIEEGFGHPTYQSEEMAEKAQELEGICDELESCVEDFSGEVPDDEEELDGNQEFEDWLEEQRSNITDKLQEADV